MTGLDDQDALAAEYVLGTLPSEERAAAKQQIAADPAFAARVAAWEKRLGPLAELVAPAAPPAGLYNKIRADIGLSAPVVPLAAAREQALVRRANRWRAAALSMTGLAASLVAVIGAERVLKPEVPTQYVAVLQTGEAKPAFLLTVDTETNMFVISAIHAPAEPKKSYQMWLVHDEMDKPKSLGVFRDGDMDVRPMATGRDHDMFMEATFTVSMEPEGGSPTGVPTGPVVFSGRLVKATP